MSESTDATHALVGIEFALGLISAKWAVPILQAVEHAPIRRGQIKRTLRGINDDRLEATLHRHLRFGLVRRAWIDGPRSQEPGYELTDRGRALLDQVEEFASWDRDHGDAARASAREWDLSHPEGAGNSSAGAL